MVPPIEYMADLRAEMATMLATMGLDSRQQHHDTAASQNTIAIGADGLVRSADRMQIYKYVVCSVAHSYGKSATFLPKPMAFEPGSGLHSAGAVARRSAGVRGPGLRRRERRLPALHRRHIASRMR